MAEEEKREVLVEEVGAAANSTETATQLAEEVKQETTGVDSSSSLLEDASPSEDAPAPQGDQSEDTSMPAPETKEDEECLQLQILVDSAVQKILTAVKGLQESFDGKLRYDAKKDAIIDRQFQELSQFKSGLVEKVTMQIVNDLIGEIDSAQKLVKFYEDAECNETNFKKLQKVLRDIPASLCDVLEKYGVTSYSSAVGTPFNPKRQRALKTTETGDVAKDKTVRELLRLGFEQELDAKDDQPAKMKILRSEMVDVFVFNPALAEASNAVTQQEPQTESVVDASASKAE